MSKSITKKFNLKFNFIFLKFNLENILYRLFILTCVGILPIILSIFFESMLFTYFASFILSISIFTMINTSSKPYKDGQISFIFNTFNDFLIKTFPLIIQTQNDSWLANSKKSEFDILYTYYQSKYKVLELKQSKQTNFITPNKNLLELQIENVLSAMEKTGIEINNFDNEIKKITNENINNSLVKLKKLRHGILFNYDKLKNVEKRFTLEEEIESEIINLSNIVNNAYKIYFELMKITEFSTSDNAYVSEKLEEMSKQIKHDKDLIRAMGSHLSSRAKFETCKIKYLHFESKLTQLENELTLILKKKIIKESD